MLTQDKVLLEPRRHFLLYFKFRMYIPAPAKKKNPISFHLKEYLQIVSTSSSWGWFRINKSTPILKMESREYIQGSLNYIIFHSFPGSPNAQIHIAFSSPLTLHYDLKQFNLNGSVGIQSKEQYCRPISHTVQEIFTIL